MLNMINLIFKKTKKRIQLDVFRKLACNSPDKTVIKKLKTTLFFAKLEKNSMLYKIHVYNCLKRRKSYLDGIGLGSIQRKRIMTVTYFVKKIQGL